MEFIHLPLSLKAPPAGGRNHLFETFGKEWEIRHFLIRLMQARRLSLPKRLLALRGAMSLIQQAMNARDEEGLLRILGQLPDGIPPKGHSPDLRYGLKVAEEMLGEIEARSRSVHDYGEAALQWFRAGAEPIGRYNEAKRRFEALLPNWETAFEQMLVNHLFFERFPFQDRPLDLDDEFLGLAAIYTLLRFLCLGSLAGHPGEEEFIDVCAATFRFISHTSFDVYASGLLKRLGCMDERQVAALIQL